MSRCHIQACCRRLIKYSKRIDKIDHTTQKLHELVKSIQNERANIKERLLVLDKDHPRFFTPDGVISFQESTHEEIEIPPASNLQSKNRSRQGQEGSIADGCDANGIDVWSSLKQRHHHQVVLGLGTYRSHNPEATAKSYHTFISAELCQK